MAVRLACSYNAGCESGAFVTTPAVTAAASCWCNSPCAVAARACGACCHRCSDRVLHLTLRGRDKPSDRVATLQVGMRCRHVGSLHAVRWTRPHLAWSSADSHRQFLRNIAGAVRCAGVSLHWSRIVQGLERLHVKMIFCEVASRKLSALELVALLPSSHTITRLRAHFHG